MQLVKHFAASKRRRVIFAQSASDVSFGRTLIEVLMSGDVYAFKVEHELHTRGFESQRPLILDLARCPFLLYEISCSASLRPSQDGQLLFLHLGPGATWNGARIKYELRWNPAHPKESVDAASCLHFPSMLPSPIGISWSEEASAAYPQQIIHFVPDELARELLVSGLPLQYGGAISGPTAFLDLVVARGTAGVEPIAGRPQSSARISNAVKALVGQGGAAQLSAACATSLEFLQGYLGQLAGLGITVCLSEDLPDAMHIGGPLLSFQRSDFDRYPLGSFGFGVELTRELASIWWGCGCRLLGKHSKEVASAIGGALSLHWGRAKDTEGSSKTIAAYEGLAGGSALKDRWLGAIGRGRPRLTAELALAFYRGLSSGRGQDALKALTADFWGLYVPVPVFLRELSRGGFDLPALP
jgi:hypothetical protein